MNLICGSVSLSNGQKLQPPTNIAARRATAPTRHCAGRMESDLLIVSVHGQRTDWLA